MHSRKLLLLLLIFVSGSWLLAGEKTLLNRIVIKFKIPVIQLPDPQGNNPISQVNVPDKALNRILQNAGAMNIKRTIPSFDPADTLKIIHGHQVSLSNLALMFTVEFPDTLGIDSILSRIGALPIVNYAVPVYHLSGTNESSVYPNDPEFQFVDSNQNGQYDPGETPGKQWGFCDFENEANPENRADINLPEAWGYTTGSSNIVIGFVEDFSAKPDLPELRNRRAGSRPGLLDEGAHATQTAGVALANTDNDTLLAGVDWQAKFYSSQHNGDTDEIADAIWYCVSAGCQVINNSWSLDDFGTDGLPILNTIRNAYLFGALVTAAMGNQGNDHERYPAGWSDIVLAVAASGRYNEHPDYSNNNYYVDLTAPGGSNDGNQENDMRVLTLTGGTTWLWGTSYSTPMVSGIASLMMSMRSDVRSEDVEAILKATATNIGEPAEWDPQTGWGKINAGKAVGMLSSAYSLSRHTATGGTVTQLDNDWQLWGFVASHVVLLVKRYRIRKNISFDSFGAPPLIWGNIAGTQGAAPSNPNYEIPWCGVVAGSVTNTGATIETYVYYIGYDIAYNPINEWYPCAPEEVVFAYTVLGVPENLTLENLSIGTTEVYAATNSITAGPNFTVESTGDVTFQAGNVITMLPGFHAVSGSKFHAYIDPELGGGGLPKMATVVADASTGAEDTETPAAEGDNESIPTTYSLSHAFPNPFNPNTTIRFGLPEASEVKFVVYDLMGREVDRLADEHLEPGYYQVVWQGRDASGRNMPSGVYIARIVTPKYTKSIKMLLLK